MLKQTIYLGSNCYVHTRKQQLLIDFSEPEKENRSLPIEDIGVIILDAPQMTLSKTLISRMLQYNVAIIVCDEKHLPKGLFLNLEANSLQQEIFREQIAASEPLKKNLWQKTIIAKIKNQAFVLQALDKPNKKMLEWASEVKSGDSENVEARAAAYYWNSVFDDIIHRFRRRRHGYQPNTLLNYGYAVLRAIVARNLTASGLMPTFGIHHRNKYNAYALADDIMEPYRPYVDWIVRDIVEKYYEETWVNEEFRLLPQIKAELLKIAFVDTVIGKKKHPLDIAVRHTTSSLADCFRQNKRKIIYPKFVSG